MPRCRDAESVAREGAIAATCPAVVDLSLATMTGLERPPTHNGLVCKTYQGAELC